jgi:hypothetical protein
MTPGAEVITRDLDTPFEFAARALAEIYDGRAPGGVWARCDPSTLSAAERVRLATVLPEVRRAMEQERARQQARLNEAVRDLERATVGLEVARGRARAAEEARARAEEIVLGCGPVCPPRDIAPRIEQIDQIRRDRTAEVERRERERTSIEVRVNTIQITIADVDTTLGQPLMQQ